MKDLLQRHKDTLDARVNMAVAYNDKIDDLRVEVGQLVSQQQKFEDVIRLEIGSINKTASDSKTMSTILDKQLKAFESESRSALTEKKDAIQELSDSFEELKAQVERSNVQRDIEIDLRLKVQDFKNNFQILSDLMEQKFAMVEDTQQAMRSMMVYQKYFYPVEL